MGKSLGPKHYINVFAEEAVIRKQIRSAVTDAGDTPAGELSPGVSNLIMMTKAAGEVDAAANLKAEALAGTLQYSHLKAVAADALVGLSTQLRDRKAEVLADKKNVKNQIKASSAEIRKRAQETLREVKELAGLLNPR